jgi:hypothetical protein
MKQEMMRVGLFVILPLLLTAFALSFIGEVGAVQYEDPILKQGGQRQPVSEEEPVISPIVKIIGFEQ